MYAHEIIGDMKHLLKNTKAHSDWHETYLNTVETLLKPLAGAQKFHFDDPKGLYTQMHPKGMQPSLKDLFDGQLGGVQFPFETTLIDYAYKSWVPDSHRDFDCPKRAILSVQTSDPNVYFIAIFLFAAETGRWDLFPGVFFCSPSMRFMETEMRKDLNLKKGHVFPVAEQAHTNKVVFRSMAPIPESQQNGFFIDAAEELYIVNLFLMLLSCKNIVSESVRRPAKLQKKRLKKGKSPLFSYKVLKVLLPGNSRASRPGTGTGNTQRMHLCRGHFKSFTEEKPLFGSHTGRYWWQPQMRGDLTKGEISKEYLTKRRK